MHIGSERSRKNNGYDPDHKSRPVHTLNFASSIIKISIMQITSAAPKSLLKTNTHTDWWQRYLQFCDGQSAQYMLWFLLPLTTLTCIFMPVSISLVYFFTGIEGIYLPFITLSMLAFFGNILLNIAGMGTRATISAYLLSILLHIAGPVTAALS